MESLLSRGQIVLDTKPPRNPAWLTPLAKYGRWRIFLRAPIALLAGVVMYLAFPVFVIFVALSHAPTLNWLLIVNDGRARLSLHRLTWVYIAFSIRINAWVLLLAQDFPPLLSEWQRSAAAAAGGTAPAEGTAPAAPPGA